MFRVSSFTCLIRSSSLLFTCLLFTLSVQAQWNFNAAETSFAETWLDAFAVSDDPEIAVAAVLLAKQHAPAMAEPILLATLSAGQPSTLLISAAIYHCASVPASAVCADAALYEQLITLDPQNLEPRLYLFDYLVTTGDIPAAFRVISEGLADTTTQDEYLTSKQAALIEVLGKAGYPGRNLPVVAEAYADPFSLYSLYNRLLLTCKQQAEQQTSFVEVCLDLGIRLGNSGRSLLAGVFGGSIQRDVLTALDADPELLALVTERREWDDRIRELAAKKLAWWSAPEIYPAEYRADLQFMPEREALLRALMKSG